MQSQLITLRMMLEREFDLPIGAGAPAPPGFVVDDDATNRERLREVFDEVLAAEKKKEAQDD